MGVLFVHGVGVTQHSDTLIDFGQYFAGWVARWQRAQHSEPAYGAAELNFTPYDSGSDTPIPYAELRMPHDPRKANSSTWVMAEAWYASSARPMSFGTMLFWSLHYLFGLIRQLVSNTWHDSTRLPESKKSVHDGGKPYRFIDVLTGVVHICGYLIVGIAGYALLVPTILVAQIPFGPIQNFALLTLFKAFLQYNASELRVYIEDDIQAANMRRRVADGIAWLTRPASDRGGGCKSVVIVAHSGGAWVAHGVLTDPTYAWARARVSKFITLGSGLNKAWQLAPPTLARLSTPVEGDIYWLDFWGSYDPVPAGWMRPPRTGEAGKPFQSDTRPWRCIYKPSGRVIKDHGLQPRADPRPPFGGVLAESPQPQVGASPAPPAANEQYWPDSVRVVNRMVALSDHGGYFTNDEEVLRRVACEIDSERYEESTFWRGHEEVLEEAIRRRRNRVALLAAGRLVAVVAGGFAALRFGSDVATYLITFGPVAAMLSGGREILRLLGTVPAVGAWLALVWLAVLVFLLWAGGAAIASLAAFVPYFGFRSVWEAIDTGQREALLRQTPGGWTRFRFPVELEDDQRTHTVFKIGDGPGVILMHEIYGFTAEVESLARYIASKSFTVYVPLLCGDIHRPASAPYLARCAAEICISKEFTIFATQKTSPIARWLRKLVDRVARESNDDARGWHGVGVIGLCLTGGFALAVATNEQVEAAVTCEPALPYPLPWNRPKASADLGLSAADLAALKERKRLTVRGYRFSCDGISPRARFETLKEALGDTFIGCEISSRPGNTWHIPKNAHSVLTADRDPRKEHPTAQALDEVIGFLAERLKR